METLNTVHRVQEPHNWPRISQTPVGQNSSRLSGRPAGVFPPPRNLRKSLHSAAQTNGLNTPQHTDSPKGSTVQGRFIKGTKHPNLLILHHRQTVPFPSTAYISSNAHPRTSPILPAGWWRWAPYLASVCSPRALTSSTR